MILNRDLDIIIAILLPQQQLLGSLDIDQELLATKCRLICTMVSMTINGKDESKHTVTATA
jgi:hypothetical protein